MALNIGLLYLSDEKWNTDHRDMYNNIEKRRRMISYEPFEKTFTFTKFPSYEANQCLYAKADVSR